MNCSTIVAPYSERHSQTFSTNGSRPRSWREMPSALSVFSTTDCVAMPAWSVPRIHLTRRPSMRRLRAIASWIVPLSAWPMCSEPVTLGGGIAIE